MSGDDEVDVGFYCLCSGHDIGFGDVGEAKQKSLGFLILEQGAIGPHSSSIK